MPQHDPGLIQHQDCGRAVQRLFNAPEEIRQHRHQVFVAQVHEVFDLKGHEAGEVQTVRVGIKEPPHRSLCGVVLNGFLNLPVLHHMVEAGQGAQMRRICGQRLHGRVDGVAMRGHDSELLQLHEGGDPFLRPSAFLFRVDALERGKGQLVRIPDIVVIAARAEAEWKQAHTFVKSEDAGVFVTTELRRDEGQQGGLARAGRPEDKRMAEITGVYVEPESSLKISIVY